MIGYLKKLKSVAAAVCCHRVIHAGVALAYGAGLAGLCEKVVVEAAVVAAYAIMAARG